MNVKIRPIKATKQFFQNRIQKNPWRMFWLGSVVTSVGGNVGSLAGKLMKAQSEKDKETAWGTFLMDMLLEIPLSLGALFFTNRK